MYKTHGLSGTRTHSVWMNMKARCNNPKHPQYKDYGGRGITYDLRWESYLNFLADMGEKPEGKSLDRFPDNDDNYCKSNCRWATREEQQRNTRVFQGTSPMPGVRWENSGKRWRAYTKMIDGKRRILYNGPDVNIAIEARTFYNEFILGVSNDDR